MSSFFVLYFLSIHHLCQLIQSITGLTPIDRQAFSTTGNLESSHKLISMSLHCGGKPKNPEETNKDMGRHAVSTQKGPSRSPIAPSCLSPPTVLNLV